MINTELMDWNVGASHFMSRPIHDQNSLNHMIYNFGFHDHHHYPPVAEMVAHDPVVVVAAVADNQKNKIHDHHQQRKKSRMTSEQLDSLERSFGEEIKLDPDRKMQLSRELGLPPRQVAIWFQNRRARWKAKQLEDLYHSLKQQFDLVSRDKHKLQQEVSALKAILHEQVQKNPVTTRNSVEETNESASVGNGTSFVKTCGHENQVNYVLNNNNVNNGTNVDYNPILVQQPPPHNNVMAFWSYQLPNSYPN